MRKPESTTLKLAKELIERPSITPHDEGCQMLMSKRLEKIGFRIQHLPFGEVKNLWAMRGEEGPLLIFAGHTDVVPPGGLNGWQSPPFIPTIRDGYLFGRGAADMKGSLAAMVTALERFVDLNPNHKGSIGFLVTSDEEGPATEGTVKVVEHLQNSNIQIDYCIIGEPTSHKTLGDVIKIGRRGSLSGLLKIIGTQGHIAYPDKAQNPIHCALKPLYDLVNTAWCQGNSDFPKTSFQISNLHAGLGAGNVIPGILECLFNFRFASELTSEQIKTRVHQLLDAADIEYELTWTLFGRPFLTKAGKLINATIKAIETITGTKTHTSTDGGTSDGRFIAQTGAEIIELGPCNNTIHSINECVAIEDLDQLTLIYEQILNLLLNDIVS